MIKLTIFFILITAVAVSARGGNRRRYPVEPPSRPYFRAQVHEANSPQGKSIMEALAALKGGLIGGGVGSFLAGSFAPRPSSATSTPSSSGSSGGTCVIVRRRRSLDVDDNDYEDEYYDLPIQGRKVIVNGNTYTGNSNNNNNGGITTGNGGFIYAGGGTIAGTGTNTGAAVTTTATGTGTGTGDNINCIIITKKKRYRFLGRNARRRSGKKLEIPEK